MFLVTVCSLLPSALGQDAPAAVDVSISLEKRVVTQYEPPVLNLEFANSSGHELGISLGYNNQKLSVSVLGPDGKLAKKPALPSEGLGTSYSIYVDAGARAALVVPLTEWFAFNKVGEYQIAVSLESASAPEERFSYRILDDHAELNLTVVPRNEGTLRLACDSFLSTIKRLPYGSQERWSAARALASINDPVAVPYLIEATGQQGLAPVMIPALARLRTRDAIAALITASKSADTETSVLARTALMNVDKIAKDK